MTTQDTYTFEIRPGQAGYVYATNQDGLTYEVYLQYRSIEPMMDGQARLTDPAERAALVAACRAYRPAAAPVVAAPSAPARPEAVVAAELASTEHAARRYDAGMNEGGEGFNPHAAPLATLQAEMSRIVEADVAAAQAAREGEWTREVTVARRASWNTWVRAQGKKIGGAQVQAQIEQQGWSHLQLAAAIKRHAL